MALSPFRFEEDDPSEWRVLVVDAGVGLLVMIVVYLVGLWLTR